MSALKWAIYLLGPVGLIAVLLIIIYLAAKRMETKRTEDFEKRDY